MTATSNLTDVQGVVAVTEDIKTAGAIVWWRLSGTTDLEALRAAWTGAGLDEEGLPAAPGPATALRRACRTQRAPRRLVRPLGRGEGFAIVDEGVRNDDLALDHAVVCKITLDDLGRVKCEAPARSLSSDEQDEISAIRTTVKKAFEHHCETLSPKDISVWLVDLMPALDAVSLRDRGGVYFVPHHNVERLNKMVGALRSVSAHIVNRVPAVHSEDAVDAILDAVDTEASAEAEAMEKDLAEATLGKRGFEHRIDKLDDVERKVSRYESLLGRKLDDLRERLESLRANLAVAVIKASSGDDKQLNLAKI